MKLMDFIVREAVIPQLSATDRDGVLRELVVSLSEAGAIEPELVEEFVAALIKREQDGSTGLGKGVAVPHVKFHPKVTKLVAAIGRSEEGLDFAAIDQQLVYIVVLLLSPEGQAKVHLAAMNKLFGRLQDDTFRRFLRQSTSREAILELLDEVDHHDEADTNR